MKPEREVLIGDVLHLDRRPIQPDPLEQYTTIGVRSFGRGIFHYDPVPGDKLGSLRFFELPASRLVVSNIKGWEGAVAVSSEEDAGCIASNRFLVYEPIDDRVDVNWARWFLLSERGNELLQRASPGSADRNRTLALKRFERLVIPLPPIEEQRSVAARVSRIVDRGVHLFDSIERRVAAAKALEVSLTTDGRPDANASWATVMLGEVVKLRSPDVAVEPDGVYRIAGVYSFGRGLIDRGAVSGSETSYRTLTRLREGDIVMSKLNGWEGAVSVVPSSYDGAHVSPEYPVFEPHRDRLVSGFFRGIARSPAFWEQLNQSVRGSMVRRRRVAANDFLDATVRLPDLATQQRVAAGIDRVEQLRVLSARAAEHAAALEASVLNNEFGA